MFTHWSAKVKAQISPAIKAHLIRGAFYLLLLLGLCVIPFALAQRNATTSAMDAAKMSLAVGVSSSSEAPKAQSSPTPNPEATAVVVWDQYNNGGTAVTLSATFTDAPAMNSDLADDFEVPAGVGFVVRWIDVDGAYFNGPGPANSFTVSFYADNDGFPGNQVYATVAPSWEQNGSTFRIYVCYAPFECFDLYPGRYWVKIQANMTAKCCGEWGWTDRTVTGLNPAVWRNPSGFFGACTNWSRRGATCGLDPSAPDQVYRIYASVIYAPTPTPTATPTATAEPTPTPSPAGCSVISSLCGTIVVGTPPTDFTVNLTRPASGVQGSDFMVNGTPANGATLSNGGTTITFHFNASPVVEGLNTMHIPACAFSCGDPGGCVYEFTCTFTYEPSTPTPTPTATATTTSTPTPTLTPQPTVTPSEAPCAAAGSQPACNSTVFTQVTDFAVYITGFVNSAPPPSVFTVNGIPADSASGGGSTIGFHFNASPVIPGQNTMNIPPDAFTCSNSGRFFEGFHCTFTYQPSTPTPTATVTPRPSPTPRASPTPRPRPSPAPRP